MNAEAQGRILERVRKMLRLANDAGATEGERDNALRMAHATLAKYNLDLATVESTTQEGNPDEPRVENLATFGGWPWARSICHAIAELFFCSYFYSKGKSDWKVKHFFIGRTSNATTAALVAEFVVTAVHREASQLARSCYAGTGYVRSFGWGAASKIRERVAELKTDDKQIEPAHTEASKQSPPAAKPLAVADVEKQALVLASVYATEETANDAYLAEHHPNLVVGRTRRSHVDMNAFDAGQMYGGRVSLAPQIKGAP